MKLKTSIVAVIASAALSMALPAVAQNTILFTGVNGGSDTGTTGNDTNEDAYTGLYSGTLNGVAVSGFICDDYNHNITIPETWQATAIQASSLNASNIGNTEFGSTIGLVGYAEVANLVSAMYTFTVSGPSSQTIDGISHVTVTDLSEAIWAITTPGGANAIKGSAGLTANATALIAYLTTGAGSYNTATAQAYLATLKSLFILTPNPNNGPQEFWAQIATPGTNNQPPVSVPEGGGTALYMLLAGLTCFGAIYVSSRRNQLRSRATA